MQIANCKLRIVRHARRPGRRGVVLLAVLVVVVVLTLAAYQFSDLMVAEYKAADSYTRSIQARAMARSGIYYAAAALSTTDNITNVLGGNPYDNSQVFQGILVQPNDNPRFQGRFSLVAPQDPDNPSSGQPYRFGVLDESGKINLNALLKLDSSGKVAHDMLMLLPNMTEDIANSILDWIDPDSDARSNGAEDDYYMGLTPPYHCKNGPLDSLEELLLVKGVTPQLLFGNDRNRNGILDPDEDDGSGTLDPGWSAYLTVYSRERNIDSTGNPRININSSDLTTLQSQLTDALGQDLANYIIAARMYGLTSMSGGGGGGGSGSGGTGGGSGSSGSMGGSGSLGSNSGSMGGGTGSGGSSSRGPTGPLATSDRAAITSQISSSLPSSGQQRLQSISSLYDLINSYVSVPQPTTSSTSRSVSSTPGGGTVAMQTTTVTQTTIIYPSPLNDPGQLQTLLPLLLDSVTTQSSPEIPARVNVLTAPRTVLAALPGVTDADVQSILDNRPAFSGEAPDPIFQTPAWLIVQANLSASTLKTLERYVTSSSQVYRVQSIGHFDGGGPTARVEAVIDTNMGRPRIIYWRDLTELGKGFNLQTGP
jgi:type II secretory pathway component PulK